MVDTRQGNLETIVTVEGLIVDTGAVRQGHFVYASGRHGPRYIEKTLLYPDPLKLDGLLGQMAKRTLELKWGNKKISRVAAPAVAGTALAFGLARHLSQLDPKNRVLWCFADRDKEGALYFREPFLNVVENNSVLLADDILTTGGSLDELAKLVRKCGGDPVAAAVLVNRGQVTAEAAGVERLIALHNLTLESYSVKECPQCEKKVPVNTEYGHGRKYLSLIARANRGEHLTPDDLEFIGRAA